jgi:tetratricopeptide (TPR) repeat protein
MKKLISYSLCVLAVCLAWPIAPAAADDDDLQEMIIAITKQIKREPRNASLYLKRGELHRLHKDWDEALTDYNRAARLDPHLDEVNLARGRLYFDTGKLDQAKSLFDRYLAAHPCDVEALMTRVQLLVKLNQPLLAAEDYTRAIEAMERPKPEHYIERAQLLLSGGERYRDQAIRGIDEGIRKLGPIVTLELFAIEIEIADGKYDAAIARVERMEKQTARKEVWLARRGEILVKALRTDEAREAFKAALAAIESLPAYHRRTRATLELEERVRSALRRLTGLTPSM